MDNRFKKDLQTFFLVFGAEQSLSEVDTEKLERVLHELQPKSLNEVQEMCTFIVEKELLEKPEEEVVDLLKEAFKK